jgi:hypothetical protein
MIEYEAHSEIRENPTTRRWVSRPPMPAVVKKPKPVQATVGLAQLAIQASRELEKLKRQGRVW